MKFNFSFFPIFFCFVFLFFTACKKDIGQNPNGTELANPHTKTFQPLLDKMVAMNDKVPGIMLSVASPKLNINWSGAAGVSDAKTTQTLHKDQPFRIASVTKTFVAASILRLLEEGKLTLDDPLQKHISEEHLKILEEGNYDPNQITIRQLLNHTSGLYDYALDGSGFVEKVKAKPQHRWTRTEQLQGAMVWGKAYGQPGKVFHYSDTGYILLGEIVERLSGQSLGLAMRELIGYQKLGLHSTWLESLEDPPANVSERIHQYLDGIDTYEWDPSCDLYGGGGLVSTTSDLSNFYQLLFNNKVFKQASTLDTMLLSNKIVNLEKVEGVEGVSKRQADYRLGIESLKIFSTEIYMHTGFWGTQTLYIPEYQTSLALNFVQGSNYSFLKKLISVVSELDLEH